MPTGRVVFYVEGRRFGFIKPDGGGDDVFVHGDHLVTKDQVVSFEIVDDNRRRKPRADNVRVRDEGGRRGSLNWVEIDNDFLLNS